MRSDVWLWCIGSATSFFRYSKFVLAVYKQLMVGTLIFKKCKLSVTWT